MQILSLSAHLISGTQEGLSSFSLDTRWRKRKRTERRIKKRDKTSVDARADPSIEAQQKP